MIKNNNNQNGSGNVANSNKIKHSTYHDEEKSKKLAGISKKQNQNKQLKKEKTKFAKLSNEHLTESIALFSNGHNNDSKFPSNEFKLVSKTDSKKPKLKQNNIPKVSKKEAENPKMDKNSKKSKPNNLKVDSKNFY